MKKNKLGIMITKSGHFQFTHGHDVHVKPDLFSAVEAKATLGRLDAEKKEKKPKRAKKEPYGNLFPNETNADATEHYPNNYPLQAKKKKHGKANQK